MREVFSAETTFDLAEEQRSRARMLNSYVGGLIARGNELLSKE
jgi:hypothetical protein